MAKQLNVAIVGLGMAGLTLARQVAAGEIESLNLVAVCDSPERLALLDEPGMKKPQLRWTPTGDAVQLASLDEPAMRNASRFSTYESMLREAPCDIVAIATPHIFHAAQAIAAMKAGRHVFCEKPLGVSTLEVNEVIKCAQETGRLLAVNLNRRLEPTHQQLKQLLSEGSMGPITRVALTATAWFRPQIYFSSSPWRATWAGEGGGLLLNQAPHSLDLLQWTCGMPSRVRSFCGFGKHHEIEAEDDVTAYMEFPSGATGIFTASTGELPGVDRLEISTDRGRLVLEGSRLELSRTSGSVREFTHSATDAFAHMSVLRSVLDVPDKADLICGVLRNLVEAIRTGSPVLCPAQDALGSLELANAMLLSTWLDSWVSLPLDAAMFDEHLRRRQKQSSLRPVANKTWSLEASLRMEPKK